MFFLLFVALIAQVVGVTSVTTPLLYYDHAYLIRHDLDINMEKAARSILLWMPENEFVQVKEILAKHLDVFVTGTKQDLIIKFNKEICVLSQSDFLLKSKNFV